ncbi:MAG: glycosyl hydrolase 2 galactose-binding domain-containing protein [Lachnospirales bacterium]
MKISIENNWILKVNNKEFTTEIPTSVYSTLLNHKVIEDPYYRDNELSLLSLNEEDYKFETFFSVDELKNNTELVFEGLDTLCDIYLNDVFLGSTNNMYRQWIFSVTDNLKIGKNSLKVVCKSPTKFIKDEDRKHHLGGSIHAMVGFPHIRKAHCMFGWDWGPRIPDMGIWKDVYINTFEEKIKDIYVEQFHDDEVYIRVNVDVEAKVEITLTDPEGKIRLIENNTKVQVENPKLWWPNGLGEQYLYTIAVETKDETIVKKIGLRTMTITREKDEYGESFSHCVNGIDFFAMGADYIPEDNLLPRVTEDRTRKLLENCALANFNCIRVWGGGYYPNDFFYDICDELGLVVWQDFMFSCAHYKVTDEFEENITMEIKDNVRRIRHHASLGLWCGNNEMEMFTADMAYHGTLENKADYIKIYEHIIPKILREEDPNTYYWPASPSSGGSFYIPNNEDFGDTHYWDVWHGAKPFTEYRKFYFRYLSEFGFQSFPEVKTINSFTLEEDRNIFSRVMEMHQRNEGANGKILGYLAQTFLYPKEFEDLIYASQLLQGEAIRYGVEHFRRNRGRCMGAIYWQLNDIWPVASWASIDYFGRWKALHYYAKRFFSPILISCNEVGETTTRPHVVLEPSEIEMSAELVIQNETQKLSKGIVQWELRNNKGCVVEQGESNIEIEPFSVLKLEKQDFSKYDCLTTYFSYKYTDGEIISKGTALFTAPKHFKFEKPNVTLSVVGDIIKVKADTFVKNIHIYSDEDMILEDNFFDVNNEEIEVKILEGSAKNLKYKSVYNIR